MKISNISRKLLSMVLVPIFSLTISSDFYKKIDHISDIILDGTISEDVPDCYKDDLLLNKLDNKKIILSLEDESIEWLDNYSDIESLTIRCNSDFDNKKDEIEKLKDCNFDNLKTLEIDIAGYREVFDKKTFSFIKNCKNLKELSLNIAYVDKDFIESLSDLEILEFHNPSFDMVLDYSKFSNLKELRFYNINRFDLAMYLSNKDIEYLMDKDIKIKTNGINFVESTIKINNEIDRIIEEIGINPKDSHRDKYDKLTYYIVNNLQYDQLLNENGYNKFIGENFKPFYDFGYLTGALFFPESCICGNYAALFQIISNRIGLDTKFVYSKNHAWNITNISEDYDNKSIYTYTDTCWLDRQLEGKDSEKMIKYTKKNNDDIWYLKKIEKNNKNDLDHLPINISNAIDISTNVDNDNLEFTPRNQHIVDLYTNYIYKILLASSVVSMVFGIKSLNNKNKIKKKQSK